MHLNSYKKQEHEENFTRNPYTKMASSLYINYLLLEMINVILASNMSFLSQQLNTDSAGISILSRYPQ